MRISDWSSDVCSSDLDDLQHLVDETVAAFGPVTALVCNAASNPYYGPSAGISDDQFRKILDNNIVANHWLIHMCAPAMQAAGKGSLTIISSIGGLKGSSNLGAYAISKGSAMHMASNLPDEFGPHTVLVYCTQTPLLKTDFATALWEIPYTQCKSHSP